MAGEKVRRTAGCVEISGRRCGFGGGAASGLSDMFQQFFRVVDDGLRSVLQQSITGAEAPGNAYAGQAGVLCCFNVHFGIADVYVRFGGSVLGGNQGEDSVRRRFLLYGVAHALRIIYQPAEEFCSQCLDAFVKFVGNDAHFNAAPAQFLQQRNNARVWGGVIVEVGGIISFECGKNRFKIRVLPALGESSGNQGVNASVSVSVFSGKLWARKA